MDRVGASVVQRVASLAVVLASGVVDDARGESSASSVREASLELRKDLLAGAAWPCRVVHEMPGTLWEAANMANRRGHQHVGDIQVSYGGLLGRWIGYVAVDGTPAGTASDACSDQQNRNRWNNHALAVGAEVGLAALRRAQ